jgi:hypothetical protein
LGKRGLHLPAPIITADSWFSDSKLMGHVRHRHQGGIVNLTQNRTKLVKSFAWRITR